MNATVKAFAGTCFWVGFLALRGADTHHDSWTYAALLFVALVVVPLLLELLLAEDRTRLAGWALTLQLPAAVLLTVGFVLPPGPAAAFAAIPWLAFTWLLAVLGLTGTFLHGWKRSIGKRCGDMALLFSAIGGGWVLIDRAGFRPLGFDASIVALTAMHFHTAGLVLPALTGFVVDRLPDLRFAARAAVGVVLGVPAVAVGIVFTRLGLGPSVEGAAGAGLALAGMTIGVLQVRIATDETGSSVARAFLAVAGASLFVGMFFAMFYALRFSRFALPWLDLAAMRTLHGTLNAIGFSLCGTIGWRMMRK